MKIVKKNIGKIATASALTVVSAQSAFATSLIPADALVFDPDTMVACAVVVAGALLTVFGLRMGLSFFRG